MKLRLDLLEHLAAEDIRKAAEFTMLTSLVNETITPKSTI